MVEWGQLDGDQIEGIDGDIQRNFLQYLQDQDVVQFFSPDEDQRLLMSATNPVIEESHVKDE